MAESGNIVVDYSGIDSLLTFLTCRQDGEERALDDILHSEGYQIFLCKHHARFTQELFRQELVLLKRQEFEHLRELIAWQSITAQQERLAAYVRILKRDERGLVSEICSRVLGWTPVYYFIDVHVSVLLDGFSHGYTHKGHSVCDLFPVLNCPKEPDHSEVRTQLLHVYYYQQINTYLQEFWYQHRDKIGDRRLYYKLAMLTELIRKGGPFFLLYHEDLLPNENSFFESDGFLTEAQEYYHRLIALFEGIDKSHHVDKYFQSKFKDFTDGRFSPLQLLGAFMLRSILKQLGMTALRSCLANPLELQMAFARAIGEKSNGNGFGVPLSQGDHPDVSEAGTAEIPRAERTQTTTGANLIRFPGKDRLEFCILFREAGAVADGPDHIGLAHLTEHYMALAVRRQTVGLTYLRGLTNRRSCLFCGTLNGRDNRRFLDVVRILLSSQDVNLQWLENARRAVEDEIALVSRNPFFHTSSQACSIMIDHDYDIRGTPEDVRKILSDDVSEFARSSFRPERMVAVYAGLNTATLKDFLSQLAEKMYRGSTDRQSYPRPCKAPLRRHQFWEKHDRPVNTCSCAFYCSGSTILDGLYGFIVTQTVRLKLARYAEENPSFAGAVMSAEFREYDGFGVIVLNLQYNPNEFGKMLIGVLEFLKHDAPERDYDDLHRLCNQRIDILKSIWSREMQELCVAAAMHAASPRIEHFPAIDKKYEPDAESIRTIAAEVARALAADDFVITGNGPVEPLPYEWLLRRKS